MSWFEIPDATLLKEGEHKSFRVRNEKLLVCRVDKMLYVVSNYCPHVGALLTTGDLSQGQITCAFHQWTFDVRTGDCTYPPRGPQLETKATREINGILEVELFE